MCCLKRASERSLAKFRPRRDRYSRCHGLTRAQPRSRVSNPSTTAIPAVAFRMDMFTVTSSAPERGKEERRTGCGDWLAEQCAGTRAQDLVPRERVGQGGTRLI